MRTIRNGQATFAFERCFWRTSQYQCCRCWGPSRLYLSWSFIYSYTSNRYKVEPFFWSSSVNWIPSRYQDDLRLGEGDRKSDVHFVHTEQVFELSLDITITLSFPRAMKWEAQYHLPISQIMRVNTTISLSSAQSTHPSEEVIDTQRPLAIRSGSFFIFLSTANYHISSSR